MTIHGYTDKNTGEYPLHEGDIRLRFPDMGDDFVCPEGFEPVMWAPVPESESRMQGFKETAPERIDGVLYQRYEPITLTIEGGHHPAVMERLRKGPAFTTVASGYINVAKLGFT